MRTKTKGQQLIQSSERHTLNLHRKEVITQPEGQPDRCTAGDFHWPPVMHMVSFSFVF